MDLRKAAKCPSFGKTRTATYNGKSLFHYTLLGLLFLSLCIATVRTVHALAMDKQTPIQLSAVHPEAVSGMERIGNKQYDAQKQSKKAIAAFEAGDYHLARRLWVPLATQGHADSQFYVGMLYDTGVSVSQDAREAFKWYERAARSGHHHAQHNLAVAFVKGEGVEKDIDKAMHWWQASARQGNVDSQYNLGIVYATGNPRVKKDIAMAKKWWRMAAISGDAMAQYNLGTLYANGDKTIRSYCEAIRWWEASAKSGFKQANMALRLLKMRDDYYSCW